jgi:hypothetical protein
MVVNVEESPYLLLISFFDMPLASQIHLTSSSVFHFDVVIRAEHFLN